jgi:hypothetical protein
LKPIVSQWISRKLAMRASISRPSTLTVSVSPTPIPMMSAASLSIETRGGPE